MIGQWSSFYVGLGISWSSIGGKSIMVHPPPGFMVLSDTEKCIPLYSIDRAK